MCEKESFYPIFFQPTSHPNSELISINCITIFSVNGEEEKLLNFDQTLVSIILQSNSTISEMEYLSIMYAFNELITKEVPKENIIMASRKLFALGFFLSQLQRVDGICEYIYVIDDLLKIIIENNKN